MGHLDCNIWRITWGEKKQTYFVDHTIKELTNESDKEVNFSYLHFVIHGYYELFPYSSKLSDTYKQLQKQNKKPSKENSILKEEITLFEDDVKSPKQNFSDLERKLTDLERKSKKTLSKNKKLLEDTVVVEDVKRI